MMDLQSLTQIFAGVDLMLQSEPGLVAARFGLIALGMLMVYLGKKGVLEPLLMIPMGLGMSTINASVMFFDPVNMVNKTPIDPVKTGTLFLDSTASNNDHLMTLMQIDWLQPFYTLAFSNGLIACLIFLGIGTLLDVGFVMARPYISMFLALFGELGTLLTLPIAAMCGMPIKEAASIALVGGADGPMVLFGSLKMAPDLFVPITVVAYLYLGLAYGGFPYLIKLMVPKRIRGIAMPADSHAASLISSNQKLTFAVVCCVLLCFLFPVASPLFFSLFLGIAIRESGLDKFRDLVSETVLYSSTLLLGLLLGVLCEAQVILSEKVLMLLLLGMMSLLLSGIGGLLGGYILYFVKRGKFNPVIGIAAVSCVPSTAKVAQKCVSEVNPGAIVMQYALGANICGVITTAIITAVYLCLLK